MSASRKRRQKHTSRGVLNSVFYTTTTDNRHIVTSAELCYVAPLAAACVDPRLDQRRDVNVPAGGIPFTTALEIDPLKRNTFQCVKVGH